MVNLSEDGTYLVDGIGLSLYTFDNDIEDNVSTCVDDCVGELAATAVAARIHACGGRGRRRSARQLQPRMTRHSRFRTTASRCTTTSGDSEPGDTNGDGLGDVWHLADPAPETPPV